MGRGAKMLTEKALMKRVRASFADEEIKKLLINDITGTKWYDINAQSHIHSTGFCYLATEVLYRLMGGSSRWWFKELQSEALPHRWHYFLEEKSTGRIVDATRDQFGHLPIHYQFATNKGVRFASKNCNAFVKYLGLWPIKNNQVGVQPEKPMV
jgi:hypothetical protein